MLRRTTKTTLPSTHETINGDLEVTGNLIGPAFSAITSAIEKLVASMHGTRTPVAPTGLAAVGGVRSVRLTWNPQSNLLNLDHYEIQVSSDGTNWYDLKNDGTDWKGTLNSDTDCQVEEYLHINLPLGGTTEVPLGVTLKYRVRTVTSMAVASSYCTEVSATTKSVAAGDLAANTVYAENIRTGEITARELLCADDGGAPIYSTWEQIPNTSCELFDLRQPDCVSNLNRFPTAREIVYFPGKLKTEAGVEYNNQWAKFTGQGTIGVFKATTNLVLSPEDFTGWTVDGCATPTLVSSYFQGKRFTRVVGNNTQVVSGVYGTTAMGAVVHSMTATMKRVSTTTTNATTFFKVYFASTGWDAELEIHVPWDKSGAHIHGGKGTIVSEKWYGDVCEITGTGEISASSSPGYYYLGMQHDAGNCTSGDIWEGTGCQFEVSSYPTPYTPTSRAVGGVNYSVPQKLLLTVETWVRPWFTYDDSGYHFVFRHDDATDVDKLRLFYDQAADKWKADITDGASYVSVSSTSAYTTNADLWQWIHLKASFDVASGAVRLWQNGVEQTATASSGTVTGASPGAAMQIGYDPLNGRTFDGLITDLLIWPTADTSVTHVGTLPTTTGAELIDHGDCDSTDGPHLAGETSFSLTSATFARDAAQKHAGSYSYKFTKGAAVGGGAAVNFHDHGPGTYNDLAGLTKGKAYTWSSWVYIPSGGIAYNEIQLQVYYSLDGANWIVAGVGSCANSYDAWQQVSVTARIAEFAVGVLVRVLALSTAALNEYFYVDDITMHELTEITGSVPYYDPAEIVNKAQTVRINKAGIRMHNAGLTITDQYNRLIDVSNASGMLARDAAGTVIHDIPTSPIVANAYPMSHTYWSAYNDAAYTLVNINNPTALTVGSWVTGVQALSLGNGRVGGAKFKVWMYGSGVANTVARGKVWLRPNGSTWSVASTNMTPNVGQELTLNGTYVLNVANVWMIDCPLPSSLKFDYYITLTPSASTWTFVIQQVAVML